MARGSLPNVRSDGDGRGWRLCLRRCGACVVDAAVTVPSPSSLKKTPGCAPLGWRRAGHLFAAAWPPHPGAGGGITGVPGGTLGCPSQVAGRSRVSPSASAAPDVDATKAEFVPCSSALHRARLPVNRAATTTPLQTPGMPSTPQEDKGVFGKKYARELSGPRVSEVRRRDGRPAREGSRQRRTTRRRKAFALVSRSSTTD